MNKRHHQNTGPASFPPLTGTQTLFPAGFCRRKASGSPVRKAMMCVMLCATALLLTSPRLEAAMTGRDIMQQVKDRNHSAQGVVLAGRMTLKDLRTGSSQTRSCITLATKVDGLTRSLFRFLSGSHKGTTFMVMETAGNAPNQQYIFLNSVGSARQVQAADKEKKFVDTDFTNEEMGGFKLDDYTYNLVGEQKAGTIDCYVVERFPKNSNSSFSKHVIFVDKVNWVPVQIRSYSRDNRLVKTYIARDVRRVAANIALPHHVEITDLAARHQTILDITYAREQAVNRAIFAPARMNVKWAEEQHAPGE
jgi:outer membrane lipoprotein-sorting protein